MIYNFIQNIICEKSYEASSGLHGETYYHHWPRK